MGRRWKGWLARVAAVALAATVAGLGTAPYRAARFEDRYPGFVVQNQELRRRFLSQPQGEPRASALATVEGNLRWAREYQRLGFDPDVFEELAFERELARAPQGFAPPGDLR